MKKKPSGIEISRRKFLYGAGGAFLALPTLSSLLLRSQIAEAQAASGKPKLVLIYLPNSVPDTAWFPGSFASAGVNQISSHGEPVFRKLSDLTSEQIPAVFASRFREFQSRMFLPSGLGVYHAPEGHHQGSHAFGGTMGADQNASDFGGYHKQVYIEQKMKKLPTLDAFLDSTNKFKAGTAYGALRMALQTGRKSFSHNVDAGLGQYLPANSSAYQIYDRLFPNGSGNTPEPPVGSRPRTRTVLSQVSAEYNSLFKSSKIGSDDRKKLEAYSQLVSEIEKELNPPGNTEPPAPVMGCEKPTRPDYKDKNGSPREGTDGLASSGTDLETVGRYCETMAKLAAAALTCDQTHIVTFNCDTPMNYSPSEAHAGEGEGSHSLERKRQIEYSKWMMDKFYFPLLAALQGTGTLDQTLVVVTTEHSGNPGLHRNIPNQPGDMGIATVLAGGGVQGNRFGNYFRYKNYDQHGWMRSALPVNAYFNSILSHMGISPDEYAAYGGSSGWGNSDSTIIDYIGITSLAARDNPISLGFKSSVIPKWKG